MSHKEVNLGDNSIRLRPLSGAVSGGGVGGVMSDKLALTNQRCQLATCTTSYLPSLTHAQRDERGGYHPNPPTPKTKQPTALNSVV